MVKRGATDLQKEYQKERRRLLQIVRRAEKQGYIFPEDIVPKPLKRVTRKAVEAIKQVTPTEIRKRGTSTLSLGETPTLPTAQKKAQAQPTVTTRKGRKIPTVDLKTTIIKIPKVKPKLTPEQLHEVNVKRGKKAWQTRRSKMTDKQYLEFVEQFKRNVAKGRKPKVQPPETTTEPIATEETTTETPYYPTLTATDIVRDKIVELERSYGADLYNTREKIAELKRVGRPPIPIENRKASLLKIFDDMVAYYSDDLDIYENYLIEHMEEIDASLDAIRYYESGRKDRSSVDVVESSFATLARILNQGSLSAWQAEEMSTMSEFTNDYGE